MYTTTTQNVTARDVRCSMDEEDMMPVFYTITRQEDQDTKAISYHIYVNSDISLPAYYVTLLEVFRTAKEEDEVHLHLNCHGGIMATAIQVRNAMLKCNCPIFTYANGVVASAATLWWLAGDYIQIEKYTSVMMHYYSGGVAGKGGDIESLAEHNKLKYAKLFKKAYKHFLTDEEFEKMLHGRDIWFNYKEAKKRKEKYVDAKLTKIAKKSVRVYDESRLSQIEELESKLQSLKTINMTVDIMKNIILTGQMPLQFADESESDSASDTDESENNIAEICSTADICEEDISTDIVDGIDIEQITPTKRKRLKKTKG